MAEALVGGAFLSAFLNVLLDRMASRQVVNFFSGQKVNNRLLEKLETAMRSASRVLDDAEEKQITSTAVWDWLAELKDAVYKADDFLDAIAYKAVYKAFPLLEVLSIKECPNLTKALPGHNLPRLTSLIIEGCEQLATPLPRLLSLDVSGCHSLESIPEEIDQIDFKQITIKGCASLKCVALDLVPKVNSLFISNCPDLESLCAHERPLNDLTSLQSLEIQECPKLVSFPKGGLPAPVLTQLVLDDCSNLKQLPESMHSLLPSLNHLQIRGCLEVELCLEGGFPSTLQSLEIRNCNKLIAGRMQWGLQTLPSLSRFVIVESFPEEMLLPSSLTSLTIYELEHLKSLDCKGLQHLTSLKQLDIGYCPLIESMPEEGLPSSLSFLSISCCPMLGESCEREKGKDWPKISHIPHIRIY